MRLLLKMTLREIKREKLQFIALVILLAVGAASFNTMLIGYRNLGITYERAYQDYHLADRWIQAYRVTQETINVNDAKLVMNQVMAEYPEAITAFEFRYVREGTLNMTTDEGFRFVKARLIGYDVTGGRVPAVNSLKIKQGRYFTDSDQWTPENPQIKALVDVHLTRYYQLSIPTALPLMTPNGTSTVQVIGTAGSPEYMLLSSGWDDLLPSARRFTLMYMPMKTVQHLFGVNDTEINEIILTFDPSVEETRRDVITNRIVALLEQQGHVLENPIDRRSWPPYELLQLDYEGFAEIAVAFPLMIFVVALIGVYIMMNRKVIAQRKEIGVSRALGYGRWSIVARYGFQAFIMGLLGGIIGIIMGIYAGQVFTDSYLDTIGVPFRYYEMYWDLLLFSIVITVGFSVMGAIIPAYNSSGVQPADSMRLDPSMHISKGGKSLVEKMLEKLHISTPLHLKLTLRSIFRNRRRSWGTIIGLSFAIMLILSSLGTYDSMVGTIDSLQENETWTLRVQYDDFKFGSKITHDMDTIKSWDGVQSVEPVVLFTTVLTANHSEEKVPIQLSVLKKDTVMHRFKYVNDDGDFKDDGIVITKPISEKLEVKVGGYVNVLHPVFNVTRIFPTLEYTIYMKNSSLKVTGIVDEINGLNSFITFTTMKSLVKTTGTEANYLYVKTSTSDPEKLDSMKKRIYREITDVQGVDMVKDLQEDWQEYFSIMIFYIMVLIIFSFIVGLTLVINTVLINIAERKRELATMRTIGESTRAIIWQLNLEHLILGVISLFIGIPLGYRAIIEIFELYNVDYFHMIIIISETSFLLTAVAMVVIVILAQLQPLHSIRKLNLAEATKEIL